MKAITLRQPWAWAIINAGRDIENRNWKTHFRGRVAIHAAAGMTHSEYDRPCEYIRGVNREIRIPAYEALERGHRDGRDRRLCPRFRFAVVHGRVRFRFSTPREIA